MSNHTDDPDELHALAAVAMDHAFRSIQPRGPLMPFALVEDSSGTRLIRAVADRLEEMLAATRWLVFESQEPARAVVACDGFSNRTGRRMDAIFVEAYESGATGGILIVQPYETRGLLKKRNEAVGRPGVLERGRPPLF
ncbi:hypothetical protein E3O44_14575 [Cryobacterium algoricola]|uniref:Uncharacterized protein n=1 Tax=Cryobacterium algoricola TaxID=1259183 RepID=A0ABY2I9B2_9MICO|nr:hypothetical protein [Cryobacterium algoricola]TFB84765.1 hypothetical protein E3O44_14575 [Cryobacterium algoricola]